MPAVRRRVDEPHVTVAEEHVPTPEIPMQPCGRLIRPAMSPIRAQTSSTTLGS